MLRLTMEEAENCYLLIISQAKTDFPQVWKSIESGPILLSQYRWKELAIKIYQIVSTAQTKK